jgi:hypothetical protein
LRFYLWDDVPSKELKCFGVVFGHALTRGLVPESCGGAAARVRRGCARPTPKGLAGVGKSVQELLAAKRDLRLPQLLANLDRIECVFLDDIGYVQHDRDEMEVLFTFLAPRPTQSGVL